MRTGEGIIDEILPNEEVKIKIRRDQLYAACSSCIGSEHVFITAKNSIGATKGQYVRYEVPDSHMVTGAAICFVLPLVAAIICGLIGNTLGESRGYNSFGSGFVGAVLGLLISFGIIRWYDGALKKKVDTRANIITIIRDADETEKE